MPEKDLPPPKARRDVAALMEPVRSALLDMEAVVLNQQGLSMWAYVVLLNLTDEPVRTQAALADAIHADRSRIIRVLDDLQERGLIHRRPDPADRRVRLLALTAHGRQLRTAAQDAIQAREDRMLSVLSPRARTEFLKTLQLLGGEQARTLLQEATEEPADPERTG
jgi:DNA-binding MarR family transcriptional regulator